MAIRAEFLIRVKSSTSEILKIFKKLENFGVNFRGAISGTFQGEFHVSLLENFLNQKKTKKVLVKVSISFAFELFVVELEKKGIQEFLVETLSLTVLNIWRDTCGEFYTHFLEVSFLWWYF